MTDSNVAVRPVHDRMPVLLLPEDYDRWLRGSLEDVVAFQQRSFPDELIEIRRTADLWVARKASAQPKGAGKDESGELARKGTVPKGTLFDC
jgi:putative SOS response-associated peptidase YedK